MCRIVLKVYSVSLHLQCITLCCVLVMMSVVKHGGSWSTGREGPSAELNLGIILSSSSFFFIYFFFLVPNHLETSPFSDSVMLDFYPADFPGGSGEMSDIPFIPALIRLTSEIIINLCHKPANDPVADSSQQWAFFRIWHSLLIVNYSSDKNNRGKDGKESIHTSTFNSGLPSEPGCSDQKIPPC